MRHLKSFIVLAVSVALLFSFSSCKKDQSSVPDNSIRKDQLLGKWNMSELLPGGFIEKDGVVLKADGTMEIDIEPQDGKADFILAWGIKNNVFTAHWDSNGVSNVWEFNAQVYPETLFITGEKIMQGANSSVSLMFGMEKQ
jgi:hypothetical protein